MEKTIKIDKGMDVVLATEQVESDVSEMLNSEFEAVDGTTLSNLKIIVKIEGENPSSFPNRENHEGDKNARK